MSADHDPKMPSAPSPQHLVDLLLALVSPDGSSIGAAALRPQVQMRLTAAGLSFTEEDYRQAQAESIAQRLLLKGQGRGGTLPRAGPAATGSAGRGQGSIATESAQRGSLEPIARPSDAWVAPLRCSLDRIVAPVES